ncbi:MAG: glutamine--fructose-6-phosphate transaminase (isomerizing) [Frankiaceae bacterium]
MCGIVACRTAGEAAEFLLPALTQLEYRGYDSAGVAVSDPDARDLAVVRSPGRLQALQREVDARRRRLTGGLGIGHTRWATHGAATVRNAHPHRDCNGDLALVHNGIVDNAAELRAELQARGHQLRTEVDSEVLVHLIEEERQGGRSLVESTWRALARAQGSWAVAVLARDSDVLVVASHRSPLVLAAAGDAILAASDVMGLLGRAATVRVLSDGDVVEIGTEVRWFTSGGDLKAPPEPVNAPWAVSDVRMGGFDDYMEKEIAEQADLSSRLLESRLPKVGDGALWRDLSLPVPARVRFVACGTSYNASAVAARVVRRVAGIPTQLVTASEHEAHLPEPDMLTVAVSQSGETADVLSAVEHLPGPLLAVTIALHSTLARRADAVLDCSAGPEIGVAATKTFTAQVIVGSALGLALAAARGVDVGEYIAALARVPIQLRAADEVAGPLAEKLATDLSAATGFLFIGRGAALPYAAEGALKLKEITYRWAECHAAGELKHGPIALIERGTPVVVIDEPENRRLDGNIAEISARGARLIKIGANGDSTFPVLGGVNGAPWGPLPAVLPLQHLARRLARTLGHDPDRPRNLAKSVTVE